MKADLEQDQSSRDSSRRLSIKNLWREPLVHFLLIGAALFLFYDMTREHGSTAPKRVVVTSGQVEQLAANFQRTWLRPPSEDELNALVENYLREEVFYREALAMGLDQNDPQVRRRMRMKLEFILEDLSAEDTTDEELTAFLQEQSARFRTQPQVSFQQVYLNADKREDLASDAQQLLVSLNDGVTPDSVGDPTLVAAEYRLATQSEIARSFGERFAKDVVKLEPGDWTGPIYSPYGGHLIKVTERVDARLPDLADIRAEVEREYQVQRRTDQKNLAYQRLREGYEITIEPLASLQGAEDEPIATDQADEAQ